MKRTAMLIALLLSSTISFSQDDTSLNDSLIYTPQYLFELMIADLEQCDLDRIELKKAKAELALIYVDLAKEQAAKNSLRSQLNSMYVWNDSLSTANMQMALENQRNMDKLKRNNRWWKFGTVSGWLTSIAVHLNWKQSWVEWGK